ncbi:MAG TPA: hypothetical protein VGI82_01685, partial [Chitinophagaceae bacterium]
MKRTFLVWFFATITIFVNAQRTYFIYLQTESGDPFFIRMNDKLYSSTKTGYLILPKLVDSTYNFKLGFPGKTLDLDFTTTLNRKDHGYLIKDLGDKGWGLFDLQTLGVLMSSSGNKSSALLNQNPGSQVNGFTDMLSKATDDPSLKQNVIFIKGDEKKPVLVQTVDKDEKTPVIVEAVVKEEKKPEVAPQPTEKLPAGKKDVTVVKEQKPDSVETNSIAKKEESKPASTGTSIDQSTTEKKDVTNTSEPKPDVVTKDPAVKSELVYKPSHVEKLSAINTAEGFESVFVDGYENGGKDTIRILIAAESTPAAVEESKPDLTNDNKKFLDMNTDTAEKTNQSRLETKNDQTKKIGLFNKNKNDANKEKRSDEKKVEPVKLWPFGKNKIDTSESKKCQNAATNDDFLKLRRKMAGKTNDDGMLGEARKYFLSKCFTTEQIGNLSS